MIYLSPLSVHVETASPGAVQPSLPSDLPSSYPSDLWQISSPFLGHPGISLGLVVGGLGLAISSLTLRLHRLKRRIQQREQRLQAALKQDSVTGLANRRGFCEQGEALLKALSHPSKGTHYRGLCPANISSGLAVLTLGLDQFQSVNNGLGHRAGDHLLKQVGQRLQQRLNAADILARTGNDEFSILLYPADFQRTIYLTECILNELSEPFQVPGGAVVVSGRIGIATWSPPPLASSAQQTAQTSEDAQTNLKGKRPTFSQLFCQAEIARSHLKANQTHRRYQLFQPRMADQRRGQLQLSQQLRKAIVRQELRVEYQPIVNLKTRQTKGFEALVRWQHPQQGRLCPDQFLPLAERLGLIIDIDRWVMTQACQQLVTWAGQGLFPSISVNLSGSHLVKPDLSVWVKQLVAQTQIDPQQLTLEVTEGVLINNPEQVIQTLQQLREIGVQISLDDFGTGFSSLSYLNRLPIDILKIDQSFIGEMSVGDHNRPTTTADAIIQSVLSLATDLNIEVVAEGVEADQQAGRLAQMRCQYGQGHWFDRSLDSARAYARLTDEQEAVLLTHS